MSKTVDAPDTGASLAGTDSYFNRIPNPGLDDCTCRGIPDGMHIPGCPHNTTPDAQRCEHCNTRCRHDHDVCSACGFRGYCEAVGPYDGRSKHYKCNRPAGHEEDGHGHTYHGDDAIVQWPMEETE